MAKPDGRNRKWGQEYKRDTKRLKCTRRAVGQPLPLGSSIAMATTAINTDSTSYECDLNRTKVPPDSIERPPGMCTGPTEGFVT